MSDQWQRTQRLIPGPRSWILLWNIFMSAVRRSYFDMKCFYFFQRLFEVVGGQLAPRVVSSLATFTLTNLSICHTTPNLSVSLLKSLSKCHLSISSVWDLSVVIAIIKPNYSGRKISGKKWEVDGYKYRKFLCRLHSCLTRATSMAATRVFTCLLVVTLVVGM